MPNYDWKCESCQKQEEVFMKIADYKEPDCCGQKMRQVICNYYVVGDLEPYVDENLTSQPVLVKSKKHRRELMREHGCSEKFGRGWF